MSCCQRSLKSDPTTDNLYQLFRAEKSVLRVALADGKPAGCCGIYPTKGLPDNCAELVKFYLSAEYRKKGIGKDVSTLPLTSTEVPCLIYSQEANCKTLLAEGQRIRI